MSSVTLGLEQHKPYFNTILVILIDKPAHPDATITLEIGFHNRKHEYSMTTHLNPAQVPPSFSTAPQFSFLS